MLSNMQKGVSMKYIDWLKYNDLEFRNDQLFFGEQQLSSLGKTYGTPLFVINETTVRKRYEELSSALNNVYSDTQIHYAVKANNNLTLLALLNDLGAHFDVVSSGEIFLCKAAGISPSKIMQTSNNWTDEELEYAVQNEVSINLDAPSQIARLKKICNSNNGKIPIISFRVNPIFGAGHHIHTITAGEHVKFGIMEDEVVDVYNQAMDAGFTSFGIHTHIGSGILNIEDFDKAVEKYFNIISKIISELDIKFKFIDFGGGLGIPYKPDQNPLSIQDYANKIKIYYDKCAKRTNLGNPQWIFEPGRFIVAESCVIVSKINTIKERKSKIFVGCDTGFNTLIRPAFYGSYHHVIPTRQVNTNFSKPIDIVGQICESGDVIARDRQFSNVREGDFLCILDAGAYGYAMSSDYNARPRAMELWISEIKSPEIIRTRGTLMDLLSHQVKPSMDSKLSRVIPFIKMHGIGNDYIYLDYLKYSYPEIDYQLLAQRISHRKYGIGGDGLVLILPGSTGTIRMRMFNADGSEAEMCGNAIRCVGGYCFQKGYIKSKIFLIETKAGPKQIIIENENLVKVNMGKPNLNGLEIPTTINRIPIIDEPMEIEGFSGAFTAISMGNPHAIYFVNNLSNLDLEWIGPKLENHPYFPERINSEFVEIVSKKEVNFRVWERGSGETWACGTGASAALVAGVLKGLLENKVLFHLKGGDLLLETNKDLTEVWKTGPWELVGEGIFNLNN
ncbi:MAG: diaminopimelate decarboxylase [Promethearchaeota archaeon]|nr:MAG: diaminopimelate decarboxylase [Candidatus Lokiarchaeota archaeon]